MHINGDGYSDRLTPGSHQRTLLLAMTITALVSAVLLYASSHSDQPLLYMLVVALFLVTMAPILLSIKRKSLDWFEPIYPVAFLYFMYFGAYSIYLVQNPFRPGRLGEYSFGGISWAVAYTILGFVCLMIGYYSSWPRRLCKGIAPLKFSTINRYVVPIIYTIYAIGLVLRAVLISKGWHIRYSAQTTVHEAAAGFYIVDYLTMLCTFSYMLAVIYYFVGVRKHGFALVVWCVLLPLEILFAFFSGIKSTFLPVSSVILLGYHYFKRRLSPYHFLAPMLFMVFVVTPIHTVYRSIDAYELRSKGFTEGLVFAIDQVIDGLSQYSLGEYLQFSYETFMERINGSGAFSLVIEGVPQNMDYQYGKTLVVAAILLVPTFVWPGKYDFCHSVVAWDDLLFGMRGMGGIAITQIGELYLNFHLFGVTIGMFLLGVFYKFVYLYFAKGRNPIGLYIFVNLWLSLIFIEFPFGAAYANMIKHVSILLVIALLVNRGRLFGKSAQRAPAPYKFSPSMGVLKQ